MSEIITNYNMAYVTNFKFEIPGASHINYFIQQLSLPSISMAGIDTFFKNNQTVMYNNTVEWSPLSLTILMDEEFENYCYLMNWMTSFIDQDVYRNLVKDTKLSILSANKKSLLIYTFVGSLPTSLSDVTFDSSTMDAQISHSLVNLDTNTSNGREF
jgi:hypothetical protein